MGKCSPYMALIWCRLSGGSCCAFAQSAMSPPLRTIDCRKQNTAATYHTTPTIITSENVQTPRSRANSPRRRRRQREGTGNERQLTFLPVGPGAFSETEGHVWRQRTQIRLRRRHCTLHANTSPTDKRLYRSLLLMSVRCSRDWYQHSGVTDRRSERSKI